MSAKKILSTNYYRPGLVGLFVELNNVVRWSSVYVTVQLAKDDHGRLVLSFTGVEGPKSDGDCLGACGQTEMHYTPDYLDEFFKPAESAGWTREKFDRLLTLWREYHLNNMKAGCEHQEALGWSCCKSHSVPGDDARVERLDNGVYTEFRYYFTVVNCTTGVKEEVLYPVLAGKPYKFTSNRIRCSMDKLSVPCPECGYKFGHEWKYKPILAAVLEELGSFNTCDAPKGWKEVLTMEF